MEGFKPKRVAAINDKNIQIMCYVTNASFINSQRITWKS